jgi:hypothetical protein
LNRFFATTLFAVGPMNQAPTPPDDRLVEPVVLLFESSPFGTLDAIVQHDGKAVYFYLHESSQGKPNVFGTRACWVRNLDIGPYVLNEDEMRQGISPMLPRTHTLLREGQPIPATEDLRIVWLEEGNGAALIEMGPDGSEMTLAMIPPWSGLEGFHGYSAQCAMESPLCWPMPDNPRLQQRIERAKEFWQQFESGPDPFSLLQPQILDAYDAQFEPSRQDPPPREASLPIQKYFSIDGGKFPPRGMVSYQSPDEIILATVGVSLCPQPAVELFTEDPRNHRRIELAIRLTGDFVESVDPARMDQIRQQLSGLAGYPWRHFTWLGNGHTCGLADVEPGCESAILVHDSILSNWMTGPFGSLSARLPEFRGDPINLLWIIPITASEQQRLQDSTLTVDEVLESRSV